MPIASPSVGSSPNARPARPRWVRYAAAAGVLAIAAASVAAYWHAREPRRHFEKALAALDAGRYDTAERELPPVEAAAEYAPHGHFLRGALLLAKRQYYPALEQFGSCRDHPELRVRALTLSGEALYQLQQYRDAASVLIQAVESDPDAVDARRWLALAYYALGLIDPAIVQLNRVAELAPSDPRPHRLMGLMYKDYEHYDTAVKMYRESLRRDAMAPEGEKVRLEMAECQIKLERLDDALSILAQCRPSPGRWSKEAECHWLAGRADQARPLVEQVLKETPADRSALLLKGDLEMRDANAAAAVDAFLRAATAYPQDYIAHYKLSLAYRRAGQREKADQHARISEELKKIRQEFTKLHETAAAEPSNPDVRCRLGLLARQLGRPDLARGWFQAALAIDPRHEETLRHLAGQVRDPTMPSESSKARTP